MAAAEDDFILRPARAEDASDIRKLILQVGINPLGLHWQRFVLAVDRQDAMIGCGQIKSHSDASRELASIAVVQGWRGRGVAGAVIHQLIATENGPLYLTCRAGLGPFYQRFGFRETIRAELSPYFQRLNRLATILDILRLMPEEGLLVMIRDGSMT